MNKRQLIACVTSVLVALVVGYVVGNAGLTRASPSQESRLQGYSNGLTNPLLECSELSEELSIGDRVKTESEIRTYVAAAEDEGMITAVAVYFRDLNNGPWFGINERQLFTPGSLLKVPLALSYYHEDRARLDQEIEFSGGGVVVAEEREFGSAEPLAPGNYTIQELVGYMLRDSNNDAAAVLSQVAGEQQVLSTYTDLGITPPAYGRDYQIDVKTFGAFFRVLFNASYVGQQGSEELLGYLTDSSFTGGLRAGVPTDVRVAHKFGVRSVSGTEKKQLHDCGIVYAENSPYILCVMTQGRDFDALAQFIAEVSRRVHTSVVQ